MAKTHEKNGMMTSTFDKLTNSFLFRVAIGFLSVILNKLGLTKDEEEGIDPLTLLVKKGIRAFRMSEYEEAERFLHDGLKMAQEQGNNDAIDHILNVMADQALETHDHEKADAVFKELMKRLIAKGVPEDDESMIEISLHLTDILVRNHKFEDAEVGYSFCVKNQWKRVKDVSLQDPSKLSEEEMNSLALYAMICDSFSKYCIKRRDFETALKYAKEAYKYCVASSGQNTEQAAVLVSDIGVIHDSLGNMKTAVKYFKKAIEIGSACNSDEVGVFYYNLGMLYYKMGESKKAISTCLQTHKLASMRGPHSLQVKAMRCVKMAKGEMKILK